MLATIYGDGVQEAREQEFLGNFIGEELEEEGFWTLDDLDRELIALVNEDKLHVVSTPKNRWEMEEIKDQDLSMDNFRELLHGITGSLIHSDHVTQLLNSTDSKAAISIRAGMAFFPGIVQAFPVEVGIITQERNEEDPREVLSLPRKLGSFVGKHAVIFDPMLATGGSMIDVINAVMERGATGVTTVSAFTSPQGLVRVGLHPAVRSMVTTPLEAGLNANAYIVGGHGRMLGDCGDRYFGNVAA